MLPNKRYYAVSEPEQAKTEDDEGGSPPVGRFMASMVPVHVQQDGFGRIFVDVCKDDHQHLTGPADPVELRKGCRVYIGDLFEHLIGKRGTIYIAIDFKEE